MLGYFFFHRGNNTPNILEHVPCVHQLDLRNYAFTLNITIEIPKEMWNYSDIHTSWLS